MMDTVNIRHLKPYYNCLFLECVNKFEDIYNVNTLTHNIMT